MYDMSVSMWLLNPSGSPRLLQLHKLFDALAFQCRGPRTGRDSLKNGNLKPWN
jgi:hypothetical protein